MATTLGTLMLGLSSGELVSLPVLNSVPPPRSAHMLTFDQQLPVMGLGIGAGE